MSSKKNRNKRHDRRYAPSAGAKITPLNQQQLMSAMQNAQSAQGTDSTQSFTPGAPVAPIPSLVTPQGPRQWTFPIGYNINMLPRSTESNSFDTLRNLATLYDGIMLCEQAWMDLCSKPEIKIVPTPDALEAVGGDETVFADDIARYREFFEYPDPGNDLDLKAWLRMAVREQLQLDALPIYVRKNRIGGVFSLEIVDGSTIKPLIDDRGRKPLPPFPAYQQYWYGSPLGWYSSDEMLYIRETERADSVYGFSRVERIILRVNQALRKQNKDLARFTDGNLPNGILEMPAPPDGEGVWTPDQILTYQQVWDGILSGNDQVRSRLRIVEPGSKFTPIDDPDVMTPFDMFLLNTTAAAYGLTMAELGFTENVNKSSGDSQENVIYRRAMRPLMNRYAQLFTFILRKFFGERRFVVTWTGFEESEDIEKQSNAYSTLVKNGIISATQAAKLMNLPTGDKEIPQYVLTANGPVFLEDLLDPAVRKAQKEAQLAGLSLAKQGKSNAPAQSEQEKTPSDGGSNGNSDRNIRIAPSAEYRRWRDAAINDLKHGRAIRNFATDSIPHDEQHMIAAGLAQCKTADEVKAVFNALKAAA